MTCREFIEFLWRYIEGELSPTERSTFNAHLAKCPHCTQYLRQYQDATRAGKVVIAVADEPVPAEVPEDLIQAILRSRTKAA